MNVFKDVASCTALHWSLHEALQSHDIFNKMVELECIIYYNDNLWNTQGIPSLRKITADHSLETTLPFNLRGLVWYLQDNAAQEFRNVY
jgi:HD superfamily phosphohydrolase YqeK